MTKANPIVRFLRCLRVWLCRALNCTLAPKITLSRWYPWNERDNFPDMDKRGVYVISQSRDIPSVKPSHLLADVIYIGETYGVHASLQQRIGQFNGAAGNGIGNHAGGRTYYENGMDPEFPDVYFAVFPCELEGQEINATWIHYIERKLIWEYVSKHGHLPECNSQ